MATKSGQSEPEKAGVVEELLDALDAAIDRVKVLYEQYFLGIQKQPPTYLHTDAERQIRDIAQLQVRNTALRYRFATLQQKYGSYNAYWRRTLRQIESGTYTRNLSKIGRQVARTGAVVPEEILAAMPKRMRDQVKRDREAALALAELRRRPSEDLEPLTLAEEAIDGDVDGEEPAAIIQESAELRQGLRTAGGVHKLDASDADFDVDAFFAAITSEGTNETTSQGEPPPPAPIAQPANLGMSNTGLPSDEQSTARQLRHGAKPWSAEQPSAGARPIPTIVIPPIGTPSAKAAPRPPSPPLSQPAQQAPVKPPALAPSQATRPIPVSPGASAARAPSAVENLAGPFPRIPSLPPLSNKPRRAGSAPPVAAEHASSPERPPAHATTPAAAPGPTPEEASPAPEEAPPSDHALPPPGERPLPRAPSPPRPPPLPPPRATAGERRAPEARQAPPPGMTDAELGALYAKYIQAKQTLGEDVGPDAYGKLLKTIHAQAPKIMEQYKSAGVDFSIVVKDNQVVIRAKPKP